MLKPQNHRFKTVVLVLSRQYPLNACGAALNNIAVMSAGVQFINTISAKALAVLKNFFCRILHGF